MFNNLQEYYNVLNENSSSSIHTLLLSNNLKRIFQTLNKLSEKDICLTELNFNEFEIKKGEYIPQSSIGNQHFPSIESFNNIEYLKERAIQCENHRFKAKYYHLIYLKSKNKQDAQKAVDIYFDLINLKTFNLNNNSEAIIFIKNFENLILLSNKIKYKQEEIIELTIQLINDSSIEGYSKYFIINFTTNNLKLTKEQKEEIFGITLKHIEGNEYPFEYLELIEKFALKIGKPAKVYQNLLGEHYVKRALDKNENFTSHKDLFDALTIFKKAGNITRSKDVSHLMQNSKSETGLKTIKFPIECEPLIWLLDVLNDSISDVIKQNSTRQIIEYLILNKDLLPNSSLFNTYYKSELQDIVTTLAFDKNNNLSFVYKGINKYNMYYQIFTKQHINQLFTKGILEEKISYLELKKYFEENTWYNILNDEYHSNNTQFNWLELLLPSIKLYFDNVSVIDNQIKPPQEILIVVIDSLTLKFEGVLRFFSQKIGAQTIRVGKDGTKENVNLEYFLDDEKLREIIPVDDLTFFKFLFSKEGVNHRNNIAHCFNSPNDYTNELFWNLITAFLRFGNYFISKEENEWKIEPRFIFD